MRMPASNIVIDAKEIERNTDEANKIKKVHLHFTISGENLTNNKMPRVFELMHKNYSMIQSVAPATEIVETYELQ